MTLNLTRQVFDVVSRKLRLSAAEYEGGTEEHDTLTDAADALDDAVDMLAELGEL